MKKEATVLKIKKNSITLFENVLLKPGYAEITNLNTTYRETSEYNGEPVLVDPELYDNFGVECSKTILGSKESWIKDPEHKLKGSIFVSEVNTTKLYKALPFVANDELRPVMNGVFLGKHIVSSDAHILYWTETGLKTPADFLFPTEVIRLLKTKRVKNFTFSYSDDLKYFQIIQDNFQIYSRFIEGNYPPYMSVVPTDYKNSIIFDGKEMILALKKILPASYKHSYLCTFDTNTAILHTENLDFDTKASVEIKKISEKVVKDGHILIGFSIKRLISCLSHFNSCVEMKFSDPSRAVIFNDEILLIPMMINA